MPRLRFTIRRMMVAVAIVAIGLALELRGFPATIYFIAPLCGALLHRAMGGRGIVGGVVGGCLAFTVDGVIWYVRDWLYPDPMYVDYIGTGLRFFLLESIGAFFGAAVGLAVWAAAQYPWLPVAPDQPKPE